MGNTAGNERRQYIDLLSIVSMLAVITLHTNGVFHQFSTERWWKTANIIEGIGYFAVPVFFMITGANLIDYPKKYNTRTFFINRIRKTVVPFIAWSLIGILFRVYYLQDYSVQDLTVPFIIYSINNTSIVAGIYWYFPALFSVYLSIPLFASVPDDKKEKVFSYIVVAGFIINSLLPYIAMFCGLSAPSFSLIVAQKYLMFTVMGYLLCRYDISRPYRWSLYALAVLGLLLKIIGTYYDSMAIGAISHRFSGYENVPSVLYATGVFVCFKYNADRLLKRERMSEAVRFFRAYTFPTYLMHWFIYRILLKELCIDYHSILYRLGAPIPIFLIAVGITWVLRKIPVVKQIVP